jgi:hypothetical protein
MIMLGRDIMRPTQLQEDLGISDRRFFLTSLLARQGMVFQILALKLSNKEAEAIRKTRK